TARWLRGAPALLQRERLLRPVAAAGCEDGRADWDQTRPVYSRWASVFFRAARCAAAVNRVPRIYDIVSKGGISMPVRKAEAEWTGGLRDGSGRVKLGSGAFEGNYSFGSRFENAKGTNPEELLGAAHAGCFSMALAAGLGKAGFQPK